MRKQIFRDCGWAMVLAGALAMGFTSPAMADDPWGTEEYTGRALSWGDEKPSARWGEDEAVKPWSPRAAAGSVYFWTTDAGTYSFTDDPKRIPERYRSRAEAREMGPLSQYRRFTRIENVRDDAAALASAKRIAVPEATCDGGVCTGVRAGVAPSYLSLNTGGRMGGGGTGISVPFQGGDESGPVVTENVRVKPRGSGATRHVTVVRQNGRVTAVIRPQDNETSATSPRESEVTGGY